MTNKTLCLLASIVTAFSLPAIAQLDPSAMPKVGTVDPRFQSYNIETVEVVGGRFWKDTPGGVTVLAMNLDRANASSVELPQKSRQYTLTSADLLSHEVQLNGTALAINSSGDLPAPGGKEVPAGRIKLSPASISFFTVATANNAACRL